jgi:hypothetical protein
MGLDGVELMVRVEQAFQISISDPVAARILTPRDLIDYVSSLVVVESSERCETQKIFYTIRQSLSTRASIQLDTKLTELFSFQPWAVIRTRLGINNLEHLPRTVFGPKLRTVRELVFWIAEENQARNKPTIWTRESIALTVRHVIADVIGLHGFSQSAQFVRDLGIN